MHARAALPTHPNGLSLTFIYCHLLFFRYLILR